MTQNKEVSIEEYMEKNKVIADFMGWVHSKEPEIDKWEMEGLKYHSDWNWTMPVWIKFRNLNIDIKEYEEWLSSLGWYLYCADEPKTFCERLFSAITWYNTTLNP